MKWRQRLDNVAPHKLPATGESRDEAAGETQYDGGLEPAVNKEIHRQQPRIIFTNRRARGEESKESPADAGPEGNRKPGPPRTDPRVNRDDQPARYPKQQSVFCEPAKRDWSNVRDFRTQASGNDADDDRQ